MRQGATSNVQPSAEEPVRANLRAKSPEQDCQRPPHQIADRSTISSERGGRPAQFLFSKSKTRTTSERVHPAVCAKSIRLRPPQYSAPPVATATSYVNADLCSIHPSFWHETFAAM
jgi:hypothetical protein